MHGPIAKTCHIIVVGNEKGGSGKSTTVINVAVALLQEGFRVATIDLDGRQRSLSRFIAHRQAYAKSRGRRLAIPTHRAVMRSDQESRRASLWADYEAFAQAVESLERSHDCIVIDTPGHDGALTRAAHSAADTLITPLNDSFIDLEVLADIKPGTRTVQSSSHYTNMVLNAQRERRAIDVALTDWLVIRNRVAALATRNQRWLVDTLQLLSGEFGFRLGGQVSERVIFRELFPLGLMALDPLEEFEDNPRSSASLHMARQEIVQLAGLLRIPSRQAAHDRLQARRTWQETSRTPLVLTDLVMQPG